MKTKTNETLDYKELRKEFIAKQKALDLLYKNKGKK